MWWNAPLKLCREHRKEEEQQLQTRCSHSHNIKLLHLCRAMQCRQETHLRTQQEVKVVKLKHKISSQLWNIFSHYV